MCVPVHVCALCMQVLVHVRVHRLMHASVRMKTRGPRGMYSSVTPSLFSGTGPLTEPEVIGLELQGTTLLLPFPQTTHTTVSSVPSRL